MTENISCTVSSLSNSNTATLISQNATVDATAIQPTDLIALSVKVLERNQCNQQRNPPATHQFHNQINAATETSYRVASTKGGNHATQKLQRLIEIVSRQYGGDEDSFLAEYIDDVILHWSSNMNAALGCFSDLATQPSVNNRK
jgi:hypothetical protein